jgi:signal transduction histidine kinase
VLIGGTLEVTSEAANGTRVRIEVPANGEVM